MEARTPLLVSQLMCTLCVSILELAPQFVPASFLKRTQFPDGLLLRSLDVWCGFRVSLGSSLTPRKEGFILCLRDGFFLQFQFTCYFTLERERTDRVVQALCWLISRPQVLSPSVDAADNLL